MTRAFSLLKVLTSAFTFKNLSVNPWKVDMNLGPLRKGHKGWADVG